MHLRRRGTRDGLCRRHAWTALAAAAVAIMNPATAQEAGADPVAAGDWRTASEADLQAVHDVLRDNAAFMVSMRDSKAAKRWLETGLRTARQELTEAVDEADGAQIVQRYAAGFRDPHVGIYQPTSGVRAPPRFWPRFTVRWRGDSYEVAFSEGRTAGTVPPVGAVLTGCDGLSSAALVDRLLRQDRTEGTGRDNPVESALSLFVRAGTRGRSDRPVKCTFELGGKARSWTLEWVQLEPATFQAAAAASVFTPAAPFGLAKWGGAGWWIGVPDMVSEEEWQSLYASVEHNLPGLRNSRYLIIDLRGNKGGNSAYGEWLANLLWGHDFVRHYRTNAGRVVYNTGPLVRQWIQSHQPHDLARFDEAVKAGRTALVIEDKLEITKAVPANPMKGKVYVLTDHACQSSCLNFLDRLLYFPRVMQVGTSTGADTIFGDLLRTPLPSGRGVLYFPVKAWIDRRRGSGESLKPRRALTWRGDLQDVSSLYRWLWRIANSENPELTR